MPSVSSKQERFMSNSPHDKAFAKKVGVPQSVGKEFSDADTSLRKRSKSDRLYKDSK